MILPKQFTDKAINLSPIGIDSLAWSKQDAVELLITITQSEFRILGGDVLEFIDGAFEYNYDNWHASDEELSIDNGISKSLNFIKQYPDGDFIFTLIFD